MEYERRVGRRICRSPCLCPELDSQGRLFKWLLQVGPWHWSPAPEHAGQNYTTRWRSRIKNQGWTTHSKDETERPGCWEKGAARLSVSACLERWKVQMINGATVTQQLDWTSETQGRRMDFRVLEFSLVACWRLRAHSEHMHLVSLETCSASQRIWASFFYKTPWLACDGDEMSEEKSHSLPTSSPVHTTACRNRTLELH